MCSRWTADTLGDHSTCYPQLASCEGPLLECKLAVAYFLVSLLKQKTQLHVHECLSKVGHKLGYAAETTRVQMECAGLSASSALPHLMSCAGCACMRCVVCAWMTCKQQANNNSSEPQVNNNYTTNQYDYQVHHLDG